MKIRRPVLLLLLAPIFAGCERTGSNDIDAGHPAIDSGHLVVDAGPADTGPPDMGEIPDAGADASELLPGRALYDTHCALCHGASGEGYLADNAPSIGGASYLSVATDEFLFDAIYDGRPGTPMSAWGVEHGGPLSGSDVTAIVALLRSWATLPAIDLSTEVVEGDPSRGAPLFATNCASCHGENGDGDTAVSLNHPNFLSTASDGFIRYAIANGRPGTSMDAWEGILPVTDIGDLVAHIRTLVREDPMMMEWPIEPAPALEGLTINPEGPSADFVLTDDRFVPAIDVKYALDIHARIVLLDARAASDWALGHIAGAAPFPFYDVDELAMYLPNDGTWIVAYCACPHAASGAVVDQLRALGFMNTAVLDEGINYWRDMDYPMARGMLP